jgi:hypothetical protein
MKGIKAVASVKENRANAKVIFLDIPELSNLVQSNAVVSGRPVETEATLPLTHLTFKEPGPFKWT